MEDNLKDIINTEYSNCCVYAMVEQCVLIKLKDISVSAYSDLYEISNYINANEIKNVIVDWNNATGLCSHILGPFSGIWKVLKVRNGKLVAINITDEPRRSLILGGEIELFHESKNMEDAIGYCK